ncbi:hypothetical protein PILCRDRAFT_822594 [Piloderma croceum F 1598]|uniref:Uncharacterized protein n=1 Tax=Piloderma croceum (strain F 1598) TaxID=765440 RepID=A0A0C3F738_PILCF|nr:hypothetical protein PILCRDRAFT_822594 [Piloderma croceum F 1598]
MVAAAAALIGIADHPAPRLLCLASILCNLGSAFVSTTFLGCFENTTAIRLDWYKGGLLFVFALSAPGGWLRWGIVTLLGALLVILWMSQPIAANVIGTIMVTVQCILFFIQSFSFRDGFANPLPITPEAYGEAREGASRSKAHHVEDAAKTGDGAV